MKKVIAIMLMVMFVAPVISFAQTTTTTTTENQTLSAKEQKKAAKELRKAEKKAMKEAKKAEKKAMKEAKKAEKKAMKEAKKLGKNIKKGEAVTLSAEKLACMKTAVAKRETSLVNAFSEFSDDSIAALTARASALADAYTKADGVERRNARDAARESFKVAMKSAHKEQEASRKTAWDTFKADAKACGVTDEESDGSSSESELEDEDDDSNEDEDEDENENENEND